MTSSADKDLIDLLVRREGTPTTVLLADNTQLTVLNIAWGYDDGDPHAHVTTNISPSSPEATVDFFSTREVGAVVDPQTGDTLLVTAWR